MPQEKLPQDLEQRLTQIDKKIKEKIRQGACEDPTKHHEVVEALEELFLAVPPEYSEFVHDRTTYLPFQYFDFYNRWFGPENAPHPEGYHFDDWVINGVINIKTIQTNLSQRQKDILKEIGKYSNDKSRKRLEEGVGSIAENVREKHEEEAAERYLLILKSRFDQSFRERNLDIVKCIYKAKDRGYLEIEKRKELNKIGRKFLGYIKQTFEFVNELPGLFSRVNPQFYQILFREDISIGMDYQDFSNLVVDCNDNLSRLTDHEVYKLAGGYKSLKDVKTASDLLIVLAKEWDKDTHLFLEEEIDGGLPSGNIGKAIMAYRQIILPIEKKEVAIRYERNEIMEHLHRELVKEDCDIDYLKRVVLPYIDEVAARIFINERGFKSIFPLQKVYYRAKVFILPTRSEDSVNAFKCFSYLMVPERISQKWLERNDWYKSWYREAETLFKLKMEEIISIRDLGNGKLREEYMRAIRDLVSKGEDKGPLWWSDLLKSIKGLDTFSIKRFFISFRNLDLSRYDREKRFYYFFSSIGAGFDELKAFNELRIESEDKNLEVNITDDLKKQCCALYPRGVYKEASLGYLIDSNIGLLHIVPYNNEKRLEPIGTAINVNANYKSNNDTIVVDSVEAGLDVNRVEDEAWIVTYFKGIVYAAKDLEKKRVIFNSHVGSLHSKRFISYLKQHCRELAEIEDVKSIKPDSYNELIKVGGVEDLKEAGAGRLHYLEAWGEPEKHNDWNTGGNKPGENKIVKGIEVVLK